MKMFCPNCQRVRETEVVYDKELKKKKVKCEECGSVLNIKESLDILDRLTLFIEATGDKGYVVYHRDIYKPVTWGMDIDNLIKNLPEHLDFTNTHYRAENLDRKKIPIDKQQVQRKDVFEAKYENGKIREIGVRLKNLDKEKDITYVIAKDGGVLTSWENNKNDHHRNLKDFNYSRDPNKGKIN